MQSSSLVSVYVGYSHLVPVRDIILKLERGKSQGSNAIRGSEVGGRMRKEGVISRLNELIFFFLSF
jgi:hypothetical protein